MEKASNLDSKMYVLDTNVLLHEPLNLFIFSRTRCCCPDDRIRRARSYKG